MRWRPPGRSRVCARLACGLIYKTSFDKANRTSRRGRRAAWHGRGPPIFSEIREPSACRSSPTSTRPTSARRSPRRSTSCRSPPSFAARPTSCSPPPATGRRNQRQEGPVPRALGHDERHRQGRRGRQRNVLLCERGASFGYNTLVSDLRACRSCAHRLPGGVRRHPLGQQPGGQGDLSGGQREFVAVLARAAVAVGVAPCSSRPTPTPTTPRPTARTWCPWATWRP